MVKNWVTLTQNLIYLHRFQLETSDHDGPGEKNLFQLVFRAVCAVVC